MKKPVIIIIRGTSGSGKTTVARKIAKNKNASCFGYDTFLYEMMPYESKSKDRFVLGTAYLEACIIVAMKAGKNIVLEGALITIDKRINDFDISSVLKLAKKYKYSAYSFKLHAMHDSALKRMKARGSIVEESIYKKIENALKMSTIANEQHIHTDQMIQDELYNLVSKSIEYR